MNEVNKGVITYPNFIGLKGMLKIPSKIKGKKLSAFLESQSGGLLYTYAQFKAGVDMITYEKGHLPEINEIPFPEFCRTNYILEGYDTYKIYISFYGLSIVAINNGTIVSFAKCGSETKISEYAQQLKRAAFSEGINATFVFDKFVDSFEGKLIALDDPKTLKAIKPTQILNIVSSFNLKAQKMKSSAKSFMSLKKLVSVVAIVAFSGAAYIGFSAFQSHLSDNEKKFNSTTDYIKMLDNKMDGLSKKIDEVLTKVEQSDSGKASEQIESSLSQVNASLRQLKNDISRLSLEVAERNEPIKEEASKIGHNPLNRVQDEVAKELEKEIKKTSSKESDPALNLFLCKPIMITDESVLCYFKGSKVTITKEPQKISGAYISYLPEKKSFLTELRGYKRITPLAVAERGFE